MESFVYISFLKRGREPMINDNMSKTWNLEPSVSNLTPSFSSFQKSQKEKVSCGKLERVYN